MGDHPLAARARGFFDAWNSGDEAAIMDTLADDVVWWEIGASEPIRGKAALAETMGREMGNWEITADLHDVVAGDDHVVGLVAAKATRGDRTLEYRTAEIFHLDESGRIKERWSFSDDTAAVVDFFS